ncbi:uncharacterized protein DS421_19g659540 [Arachis hypogaea]|uniref:Uncharacterized protein n=1 Tax=Arachis hypogaea TaxID=3818 RepID=A0A6B9VB80_ARAHY|nr:uncharacterized protein DS421_19g659540 [Arachis hypogaea]
MKVKRRMMMMRVFWSKNLGKDDFKVFLNVRDDFNSKKTSGTNLIFATYLRDDFST